MKPFEFVLIIVSVIMGLAFTECAMGVADMIANRAVANFYWAHIVLCIFGLMASLNYWAAVYKMRHEENWTIPLTGIVVASSMIYFIASRLAFPHTGGFDYKKHFEENIAIILLLTVFFIASFMMEAYFIRKSRKFKTYIAGFAFLVVVISGILIDNLMYRSVLTVLLLLMQGFYMHSSRVAIREKESPSKLDGGKKVE